MNRINKSTIFYDIFFIIRLCARVSKNLESLENKGKNGKKICEKIKKYKKCLCVYIFF